MDEAGLCDRVALMQSGKILSINTPQGVIDSFGKPLLAVKAVDMLRLLKVMKEYDEAEDCYPFGEFHHVVMKNNFDEGRLKNYLQQHSFQELEIKNVKPDIEDCFIDLMKG
jgi:ABC-type multidrug transport system ATPase subunit